jgi:hypothetical protein
MDKKILLKKILSEAVKRNLEEMPQIQRFYTLTDDWEEKAEGLRSLGGIKVQDAILKLESMEDMNYFTRSDIQQVFKFARPQGANNFIKTLLQQGVIMPVSGAKVQAKNLGVDSDTDDEFNVSALPGLDISQGIDLESALSKIKIEKNTPWFNFIIEKTYKVELPREEQRKLAVQYGSLAKGLYEKYGVMTYNDGSNLVHEIHYKTTPYRFLKPFLEKKHYKQIPSDEPIVIKRGTWQEPSKKYKITDLFPTVDDFEKFVENNPRSFQIKSKPANFNGMVSKIESDGGTLVLTKEQSGITTNNYL